MRQAGTSTDARAKSQVVHPILALPCTGTHGARTGTHGHARARTGARMGSTQLQTPMLVVQVHGQWVAMQLPCHCHAIAMPLPCHCQAIALPLPCQAQYCHDTHVIAAKLDSCHAIILSLPIQSIHVLLTAQAMLSWLLATSCFPPGVDPPHLWLMCASRTFQKHSHAFYCEEHSCGRLASTSIVSVRQNMSVARHLSAPPGQCPPPVAEIPPAKPKGRVARIAGLSASASKASPPSSQHYSARVLLSRWSVWAREVAGVVMVRDVQRVTPGTHSGRSRRESLRWLLDDHSAPVSLAESHSLRSRWWRLTR